MIGRGLEAKGGKISPGSGLIKESAQAETAGFAR